MRHTSLYILIDKIPVPVNDVMQWAIMFEKPLSRRVAYTELSGGINVSTVFLGIDHGYGEGEPVLFETMIFGGKRNEYQERYCTWEEAEVGHLLAVTLADNDRYNWLVALWMRLKAWFEYHHQMRVLKNTNITSLTKKLRKLTKKLNNLI